jgi:hypothetical protein
MNMRLPVRTLAISVLAIIAVAGCDDESSMQAAPNCTAPDQAVASEPNWRDFADYRTWTREGCDVRIDVLADRPGPDHCDLGSVRVIITGDPLGSRYTNDGDDIEYIRDPLDRAGFKAELQQDAVLPPDAEFTGYQSGREELWVEPDNPDAIFIVDRSEVERWPRGEAPLCG